MPSASSDDDHKLQTSILHSRDDLDFIDDGADESHAGYDNT